MSYSRKQHVVNPPRYSNKSNYGKESFFEPKRKTINKKNKKPAKLKSSQKEHLKHTSLTKTFSNSDSKITLLSRKTLKNKHVKTYDYSSGGLSLSSRITLISFTLLLLSVAVAAEMEKISFAHKSTTGSDVNTEIKRSDFSLRDPHGKLGDQHVVKMDLASNSIKLSDSCLRTAELGCRIDGADQGHTVALRSTHYAAINPNLDHDGPYPDHSTYAITHHYQCSGEGDLSTFDVLDASSRTNFMLVSKAASSELIIQHGAHGIVKEHSTDLLSSTDGSIRAKIIEEGHPHSTTRVDRSISLSVKKDYMSADVNVQHVKEGEAVYIHATQQDNSITIQASTLPDHEVTFPPLKTVHGCRSLKAPTQTHTTAKHMQLFYKPERDKTQVELTTDAGKTTVNYPKKLI
jgi:hypothetical protein